MDMKDQKLATEIAEERMTLIAPLLSQNLDKDSVRLIRAEICERNQISQRTLERYLTSYLKGGFDALKPQSRSAECKYKIPQELLDEAIRLRRELPSRSVPTIIKILELEGKAEPGFLKRTTLQDALSRAGYSSAMMSLYNDKGYASQRFQRAHRHDLWQGDIKYGLILNLGGKTTQTYFSCLIDDATRYILHGEFYGNMEQGIVEDTLRKAMTKYGLPKRLYFDNGSQYRTRWMKRACGLLGIRLLYAKPRNPQGKGKQERFNQTLEAFLAEVALHPPESLQELNAQFNASIVLGWSMAGEISRLIRTNLIDVIQADYITTAKAKGKSRMGIVIFHALKMSILPVITIMMMQFTSLLGGALITENIFSIPGIGTLSISALSNRDIPLLQGTIILSTFLIIIGNLIADIIYALADPRVHYD